MLRLFITLAWSFICMPTFATHHIPVQVLAANPQGPFSTVMSYLQPQDLHRMREVCKPWNSAANNKIERICDFYTTEWKSSDDGSDDKTEYHREIEFLTKKYSLLPYFTQRARHVPMRASTQQFEQYQQTFRVQLNAFIKQWLNKPNIPERIELEQRTIALFATHITALKLWKKQAPALFHDKPIIIGEAKRDYTAALYDFATPIWTHYVPRYATTIDRIAITNHLIQMVQQLRAMLTEQKIEEKILPAAAMEAHAHFLMTMFVNDSVENKKFLMKSIELWDTLLPTLEKCNEPAKKDYYNRAFVAYAAGSEDPTQEATEEHLTCMLKASVCLAKMNKL